jgi:cystine transport system substrate-binding protein
MYPLLAASLALPALRGRPAGRAKARGSLRIAMEGTYPPFNFKDQKTGQLAGYDVDVAAWWPPGWASSLNSSPPSGRDPGRPGRRQVRRHRQPGRHHAQAPAGLRFLHPYTYSSPQLIVRKSDPPPTRRWPT